MITPPLGKSLRIFLADGSPSGIRHAELVNWSGQALVCPRTRFKELSRWEEAQRPGVYFLIGEDLETERDLVYIGEAENVQMRLGTHYRKSEFWRTALLFTSKDENLTKSHVKYLEARLIEHAREVGRVALKNAVTPAKPRIPRADQVDMEGFLVPIVTLSGALGFRFLERARVGGARTTKPPVESANDAKQSNDETLLNEGQIIFCFQRGGYCSATGSPTDDGFLIYQGARGPVAQKEYVKPTRQRRIEQLLSQGAIKVEGEHFVTLQDLEFSSPSGAAGFVSGASINGRKEWRLSDGKDLAAWEAENLKASGQSLTQSS